MTPTLLATPACTGCGHRFQLDSTLHCTACQLPYGGQSPDSLLRQRRILVCKSCRHLVLRNSEQQCSHCGSPRWGYLEFALDNNMTLPLSEARNAPPAAVPAPRPAQAPAPVLRQVPAAADIPQTNTQWTDIHPGIYALPARVFRHPSERMALIITGLLTLPLLGYAVYEGYWWVICLAFLLPVLMIWLRVYQSGILGSCVRVSANQFPEVHQMVTASAERLRMRVPPVYILQSPELNAFAIGFRFASPSIVIQTGLMDALTEAELQFVVSHELTHLKCGHTFWTALSGGAHTTGINPLFYIQRFLFLAWSRRAEYTADRGGLLGSLDLNASLSALCKLAVGKTLFHRLRFDEFLQQGAEIKESTLKTLAENLGDHPFLTNRLQHLVAYSQTPDFRRLVQ